MKTIIIILLIITPITAHSELWSTEEWISRYLSPCPKTPGNRVCYNKTKRNFKRMLEYKDLIFKHLDRNGLPRWLATICIIESECTENAISKAGAIGLFQIMPSNLVYYLTKKSKKPKFGYWIIAKPTRKTAINAAKDAETNTEIACKMLKHLYEKYGKNSHEVVVRAYNAGETRIDRALKGIGKPLTHETLNYLPQLLALQEIMDAADVYLSD
jgi:membrane-bound lytic murein transglycosylase D